MPLFLTAVVTYAVLLGFLVIAMLDAYENAHSTTALEASLLAVQSQFQWNQRTSLLATAIREAAK